MRIFHFIWTLFFHPEFLLIHAHHNAKRQKWNPFWNIPIKTKQNRFAITGYNNSTKISTKPGKQSVDKEKSFSVLFDGSKTWHLQYKSRENIKIWMKETSKFSTLHFLSSNQDYTRFFESHREYRSSFIHRNYGATFKLWNTCREMLKGNFNVSALGFLALSVVILVIYFWFVRCALHFVWLCKYECKSNEIIRYIFFFM